MMASHLKKINFNFCLIVAKQMQKKFTNETKYAFGNLYRKLI